MTLYGRSTLMVLGALLCLAGTAPAAVYDWSYTGSPLLDRASGTLTTGSLDPSNSLNSPAGYDITAITGTYNGSSITGLLAPGSCCSVPANDNIVYYSPTPGAVYLDQAGLAFTDALGGEINIYSYNGAGLYADILAPPGSANGPFITSGIFSLTPVAVPEPGSLAVLGSGLVALAVFTRRRRKNV